MKIHFPIPLKTRSVGQRCTLNLSRAETSSRWCEVVVRREEGSSEYLYPSEHGKPLSLYGFGFVLIVRVQHFVRGGFVGHRSRASSKHLYSHLPVDWVRFLGGQKGLRYSCKMHVWVSGSPKISTAAGSGYVTALALSHRTFLLRKV
ncbi:hypothetical protein TNCV_934091 [Trichonephila clavipes]|nr:hypothetical protein TNCV_934091 [Trichonephila clavipes]